MTGYQQALSTVQGSQVSFKSIECLSRKRW
jgi:hypothetical protein